MRDDRDERRRRPRDRLLNRDRDRDQPLPRVPLPLFESVSSSPLSSRVRDDAPVPPDDWVRLPDDDDDAAAADADRAPPCRAIEVSSRSRAASISASRWSSVAPSRCCARRPAPNSDSRPSRVANASPMMSLSAAMSRLMPSRRSWVASRWRAVSRADASRAWARSAIWRSRWRVSHETDSPRPPCWSDLWCIQSVLTGAAALGANDAANSSSRPTSTRSSNGSLDRAADP